MSAGKVHHPIFARLFNAACPMMEREVGPLRAELLRGLSGRVLEIGAGNGANFRHYPATVEEVVALEPEGHLRGKALEAAGPAGVQVRVDDCTAYPLQFAAHTFDAAVASLVLCTVPDPAYALAELRRVLKPGGELRFLEHVRSDRPGRARRQRLLDGSRLWPLLGGGCHCSRDTTHAIEAAGFEVERIRSIDIGAAWMHTNPHIIGTARTGTD